MEKFRENWFRMDGWRLPNQSVIACKDQLNDIAWKRPSTDVQTI